MQQLEMQIPSSNDEVHSNKDWISQAISTDFEDSDARRGSHFSPYISRLEAIALAANAIAHGDPYHDDVSHDFCDEEGLYGDARTEVLCLVFEEFNALRDFFSEP